MNVGFLPRVLPTTPTGRPSLGRIGLARPRAAQLPQQNTSAATTDDAIVAAGPRKRRRNPTLNVDLRPATPTANPLARLWASLLVLVANATARAGAVRLPSFSRSTAATPAVDASTDTAVAPTVPADRHALANLRASVVQAAAAVHSRLAPAVSGARTRLAPLTSAAATRLAPVTQRVGARAQRTSLPGPLADLQLSTVLAPIGRIDRRVLAILGVLSVAAIYGVTVAEPPSIQQVAAAERSAAPAAKPATQTPPTDPALADPFSQKSINTELRSLRKALEPGDQARSITVLSDGTMGMNIVNGGTTANVMVRGQDLAIEPLAADPGRGASLDLQRVHGTAITRFLDEAASAFSLPKAKLGSLRLIENDAKPGSFIWIGVWNDPARTTLYADREAQAVGESRPR